MKNVILSIAFIFAIGSFANANNNKEVNLKNAIDILVIENVVNSTSNVLVVSDNCFQDAWDYGTRMGGGDEYWTWYYTNQYYNANCVPQEK